MNKKNGILGQKYALERKVKTEMVFRYKARAYLAYQAIQKYSVRKKNLNILDFGSAEGANLIVLNKLLPECNFIGVEYSQKLIDFGKFKLPENITIIKDDVCNLNDEIKKKKYDAVTALALLEHLHDPFSAIKEAYNVLKSGGIFIATSPRPFWDYLSTKLRLLRKEQHEIEMSKKIIINFFKNAGFQYIIFDKFMWAPISFLPYMKIPVSPSFSLKIDSTIKKIYIFNWLFVNQIAIGRK